MKKCLKSLFMIICGIVFCLSGCASNQTESMGTPTSEKGYGLSYEGISIEVNADAAPVLDKLGEPASFFEAPECAFEGKDTLYDYGHFELDVFSNEKIAIIYSIVFKDDLIETAEGVCIGDSSEKVKSVYGESESTTTGILSYRAADMKLEFDLKEGEVISIRYISTKDF